MNRFRYISTPYDAIKRIVPATTTVKLLASCPTTACTNLSRNRCFLPFRPVLSKGEKVDFAVRLAAMP